MPSFSNNKLDAIIEFEKIKIKSKNWDNLKQEDLKINILKDSNSSGMD